MANQNINQKPQQGQQGQQQQQPNKNWNQEQTGGQRSTVQPGSKQPQRDTDTSLEE